MSIPSSLHFPFAERVPQPGQWLAVAPGLLWARHPLPFALDHINVWAIRSAAQAGWTLVDCGIGDATTQAHWSCLLADPALEGLPVLRVLVTHCHPDHVGCADWLCQRLNVDLWMSAGEYAFARMMSAGLSGADGTAMLPHFFRHGLPRTEEARLAERRQYYPTLVPSVPAAYRRLGAGLPLGLDATAWHTITGYGHSPEHIALAEPQRALLISGDMLLPRISTNVSVFAIEPESDPVHRYLESLDDFMPLPADTLVLPAHGRPFVGIAARIQQLRAHHAERLERVRLQCAAPRSAYDLLPCLFSRALDAHQLSFAMGEAIAHAHALWYDGTLERLHGEDGVLRFVQRVRPEQ